MGFAHFSTLTLAQRLRRLRRQAGLRACDVADRIGIMRSTYSRYERNEIGNPSLKRLRQIAAALGCTVGALCD